MLNNIQQTAFEISLDQNDAATAQALLEAEEAQIQRPRLWKLSSLSKGERFLGGVLQRWEILRKLPLMH